MVVSTAVAAVIRTVQQGRKRPGTDKWLVRCAFIVPNPAARVCRCKAPLSESYVIRPERGPKLPPTGLSYKGEARTRRLCCSIAFDT